jgi:hypothetical protein
LLENSTILHGNMFLLHHFYIKNSNDFDKMLIYIVHNWYISYIVIWQQHEFWFQLWTMYTTLCQMEKWPKQNLCILISSATLLFTTFSIKIICYPKILSNFSHFEIQVLNCSNKIRWKIDQNKSCRSQWFVQLCCCWLFHLN